MAGFDTNLNYGTFDPGKFETIQNPQSKGQFLLFYSVFSLAIHFVGPFLLVLLIERNNLPWRNARESNEIPLNVDMREASKAIPRTHTVMPTLDDIINELKGATVFSHLDMNQGYRQLELKAIAATSPLLQHM